LIPAAVHINAACFARLSGEQAAFVFCGKIFGASGEVRAQLVKIDGWVGY
jgi:hypothetical protein